MSTPKAAKAATSATERALKIVENSSRVRVQDLKDNFGAKTARGFVTKYTNHYGKSLGALDSAAKPPLGWIWGNFFQPWQRLFPGMKQFNADINLRREVVPLTLIELARLIDLGWVDTNHRIDLVTLLRTRRFDLNPGLRQCGFYLTEQGADIFKYPIDIEVQYANQSAIAAIEQVGGRIRCAYYDQRSVEAAVDPLKWFRSGQPIPSRRAPPPSLIEYYTSPANRGYLCSEEELSEARKEMSMVRGYDLPENEVRLGEKHKNQVFSCLPPGAIVSVADRKVFAPTGEAHVKYYTEEAKADAAYS